MVEFIKSTCLSLATLTMSGRDADFSIFLLFKLHEIRFRRSCLETSSLIRTASHILTEGYKISYNTIAVKIICIIDFSFNNTIQ